MRANKTTNKGQVEGLLLHLVRGAKKHGTIDLPYLRSVIKRHKIEVRLDDLISE